MFGEDFWYLVCFNWQLVFGLVQLFLVFGSVHLVLVFGLLLQLAFGIWYGTFGF